MLSGFCPGGSRSPDSLQVYKVCIFVVVLPSDTQKTMRFARIVGDRNRNYSDWYSPPSGLSRP
jgi:hypothetical protein